MDRRRRHLFHVILGALGLLCLSLSCARLPYTTKVVHKDPRVEVSLQRPVDDPAYSHPAHLNAAELASILQGFSFRPKQRLPLRWFAEENPPKPVLRQDEVEAVTRALSEGLRTAGPGERVHFELRAPGFNPAARRDVVGGWVAVREPHFYLTLEYHHAQIPTHKSDPYDYNYPTPPPPPFEYLLYFEPGRFWVTDERGAPALQYREFLKAPRTPATPGP